MDYNLAFYFIKKLLSIINLNKLLVFCFLRKCSHFCMSKASLTFTQNYKWIKIIIYNSLLVSWPFISHSFYTFTFEMFLSFHNSLRKAMNFNSFSSVYIPEPVDFPRNFRYRWVVHLLTSGFYGTLTLVHYSHACGVGALGLRLGFLHGKTKKIQDIMLRSRLCD